MNIESERFERTSPDDAPEHRPLECKSIATDEPAASLRRVLAGSLCLPAGGLSALCRLDVAGIIPRYESEQLARVVLLFNEDPLLVAGAPLSTLRRWEECANRARSDLEDLISIGSWRRAGCSDEVIAQNDVDLRRLVGFKIDLAGDDINELVIDLSRLEWALGLCVEAGDRRALLSTLHTHSIFQDNELDRFALTLQQRTAIPFEERERVFQNDVAVIECFLNEANEIDLGLRHAIVRTIARRFIREYDDFPAADHIRSLLWNPHAADSLSSPQLSYGTQSLLLEMLLLSGATLSIEELGAISARADLVQSPEQIAASERSYHQDMNRVYDRSGVLFRHPIWTHRSPCIVTLPHTLTGDSLAAFLWESSNALEALNIHDVFFEPNPTAQFGVQQFRLYYRCREEPAPLLRTREEPAGTDSALEVA